MADMTEWRERALARVGAKVAERMAVLLAEEPATEPAENATENGFLSGAQVHVLYELVESTGYGHLDRVVLGVCSGEDQVRDVVARIVRQRNAVLEDRLVGWPNPEEVLANQAMTLERGGLGARSLNGTAVISVPFVVDEI